MHGTTRWSGGEAGTGACRCCQRRALRYAVQCWGGVMGGPPRGPGVGVYTGGERARWRAPLGAMRGMAGGKSLWGRGKKI